MTEVLQILSQTLYFKFSEGVYVMKAILVLFAVILVVAIVVVIPELKVGMDAVQQVGGVLP